MIEQFSQAPDVRQRQQGKLAKTSFVNEIVRRLRDGYSLPTHGAGTPDEIPPSFSFMGMLFAQGPHNESDFSGPDNARKYWVWPLFLAGVPAGSSPEDQPVYQPQSIAQEDIILAHWLKDSTSPWPRIPPGSLVRVWVQWDGGTTGFPGDDPKLRYVITDTIPFAGVPLKIIGAESGPPGAYAVKVGKVGSGPVPPAGLGDYSDNITATMINQFEWKLDTGAWSAHHVIPSDDEVYGWWTGTVWATNYRVGVVRVRQNSSTGDLEQTFAYKGNDDTYYSDTDFVPFAIATTCTSTPAAELMSIMGF